MLPYHAMLLLQISSESFVLGFFESSGEGGSSDGGQDDGGLGRNIRMSTIMGMLDRAAADIYGLQVEFERLDTGGCPSRQHQVRWMRSVFLGKGFCGCAFRVYMATARNSCPVLACTFYNGPRTVLRTITGQ